MTDRSRVLMVAYHYPPCFGSSGVHRTLKFSRYLPDAGWDPIVLTTHPRAYEATSTAQLEEIPASVPVTRAFALDARRHLSIRGRSLRALGLPDRWANWWVAGVVQGLRLIRRHRPDVLWSTYPIATAHLIGWTLQSATGIPWVADFRDPMTEGDYPYDPWVHRTYETIERACVRRAAKLVFTAPGARDLYLKRYPRLTSDRCTVISNGYDEQDFRALSVPTPSASSVTRLVHSGLVYPQERDPRPLFRALRRLKQAGTVSAANLAVELRAAGSEDYFRRIIAELSIGDIVTLLPALPYQEALADCASADALLLLQDASCNGQIPAKAYEYLRIGRPILALTPAEGDTAALLREAGGSTIFDLMDEAEIERGLPKFLTSVRTGSHLRPTMEVVRRYARHAQTADLATVLTGARG